MSGQRWIKEPILVQLSTDKGKEIDYVIFVKVHFAKFAAKSTPVLHFYANNSVRPTENPMSIFELTVPVACNMSSSYSSLSFNL